jgi:hypothetical protein
MSRKKMIRSIHREFNRQKRRNCAAEKEERRKKREEENDFQVVVT